MSKVLETLHRLIGWASVMSLAMMIFCVVIQVFSRFFLENTPSWTEELSRFFFIYSIAFGTGLAFKNENIVRLDLISHFVGMRTYQTIELFIHVFISGFGFFMFFYAWDFVGLGLNEHSPALQMSMTFSFAALPVMMLMIFTSALLQIINHFKKVKA